MRIDGACQAAAQNERGPGRSEANQVPSWRRRENESTLCLQIGLTQSPRRPFLNGRILYRGRSAQNFRDPAFLGIVDPENDAVYLPLKKDRNELTLAVSELGSGWGFISRLADVEN